MQILRAAAFYGPLLATFGQTRTSPIPFGRRSERSRKRRRRRRLAVRLLD